MFFAFMFYMFRLPLFMRRIMAYYRCERAIINGSDYAEPFIRRLPILYYRELTPIRRLAKRCDR